LTSRLINGILVLEREGRAMLKYNDDVNCKIVNMRVKESPLVLCNTLFKVVDHKTDVEGYWLDDSKVYFDYIEPVNYFAIDSYYFRLAVQRLIADGELCVFYKNFKNYGVLEYANGKELVIRERLEYIRESRPDKDELADLLEQYGGLTLYKLADNCHVIEIYNLNYGSDESERR
jgi:hypothetical protein